MAPKRTSNGESKFGSAQKSQTTTKSSRKILITAGEGQTGRLIIELLTTDDTYAGKYDELTALVFSEQAKAVLEEFDTVKTIVYDPKDEEALVQAMSLVDTCLLIPPARKDKANITRTLLSAAKSAKTVQNLILLSSAGADYAEHATQPRLREFIDLEVLAMQPKGDTSSGKTGHSPCVIRAGFYTENLLLYAKQAQGEGKLKLPIGEDHKFAPVALGDIAQIAAYVVTSEGPQGLADNVRGQVIVATGPQLTAGPELAEAASQALGTKMEFESIDEATAKNILNSEQGEEVDEAEREYLLEYYALVRAGKTNYVATTAMLAFLGHRGQEPTEFFETYSAEFKPKKRRTTKNGGAEVATKNAPTRASGRGKGEAASAKDAADEEDVEM
ncbi:NAD-P-binding protein [Trametes versicolor FP-101664 SS1]|uniref:NAD-P-binding protein n=1 Tax=Trametes versicolor (strain FP-101664) TaxID=717944 RepID=UPI0004623E4F|nr:NAD-P-binding protein [Trametes versicolor FP-101664 SS1]EIW57023.1 NAD-P-binding protein [Trametes versicolor FP-101664 SS1]